MNTFYEFFAGGGMARAGLGGDWRCLFANDICPKKATAYVENWGKEHLRVDDVYRVKSRDLPGRADLMWGSFPCQDLSLAGAGKGLAGDRSSAFWGYWKLVQALKRVGRKPKMVVLENVFGTLTSHGGGDFEQIVKALVRERYLVGALVIDAVHFVPQSRPRLFIVGVDESLSLPAGVFADGPSPSWHPTAMIRAYNNIAPDIRSQWRWWSMPIPVNSIVTLEGIIDDDPEGVTWHSAEETRSLLQMMSPLNRKKVLQVQKSSARRVGAIYRRTRNGVQRAEVRFDGIAGCLRTPSGGSSRQTILVVEGAKLRTRLISSREAARLMGLDESYILPKRYNDAYHLIGDGVVVPVVRHLSCSLLEPVLLHNRSLRDAGRIRAAA